MTESGKTTLAKELAKRLKASNRPVIVLDPMHDEWSCDFRTDDQAEFLNLFWSPEWKNRDMGAHVFIDESGDAIGRYNTLMNQTATRGRHWGHSCYFLTQRGAQLSPTVRDQCSHLFLFVSGLKDCKIHAEEWNKPELVEAANLPQGDYFHVQRHGPISRGNIFNQINKE